MQYFDLLIPTRDSALWLPVFLDRYRAIGVDPLYVVDTRSRDDTLKILEERGVNFVCFTPKGNFAEDGMIEYGVNHSQAQWILRIDDDEFVPRSLLSWVQEEIEISNCDAYSISCREVHIRNGLFVYSRWPSRIGWNGDYNMLNPQLRLFRKGAVEFVREVHTSGVKHPQRHGYAPSDIFFIHCNCILRDANRRLAKIRAYARDKMELSWMCVDESLPEIFPCEAYNYSSDQLSEFDKLFEALPLAGHQIPDLTKEELQMINGASLKWLAAHAVLAQDIIRQKEEDAARQRQHLREAQLLRDSPLAVLSAVERFCLELPGGKSGLALIEREFSKTLCTLGFRGLGEQLWNHASELGKR